MRLNPFRQMADQVELLQVDAFPRYGRIVLKRRFDVFARRIQRRRVHLAKCAACSVLDNLGPRVVRFAQRDGIRMTRPAVAAERFIGNLGDVWTTHHDLGAGGANGVGHAIGTGSHAGHRADAGQLDVVGANIVAEFSLCHGLRITVDKKHLVLRRRERLEQEHPEVWHEVLGHAIVRTIQKNIQCPAPKSNLNVLYK